MLTNDVFTKSVIPTTVEEIMIPNGKSETKSKH